MKDNRDMLIHEMDAATKEVDRYELLINECKRDLEVINDIMIKLTGEIYECRKQ
ncbi:hypothetical protein GCM10007981_15940 [Thermocladium modestius]|uniref:Uncharacterized protein n=1 Tax=Thermocladium modestius TaxID=62609 RepID=A0A830GWQ8_9CREN|nr:hypothetical protein [Thermocladium modestius]GGP21960.1 hypothetical protein GCM10007981_15940 [Thermocladium modestius]